MTAGKDRQLHFNFNSKKKQEAALSPPWLKPGVSALNLDDYQSSQALATAGLQTFFVIQKT
ncbi:hypothetical protein CCP3SC5AM1_180019 [Gammaproteobacteria bacterium]